MAWPPPTLPTTRTDTTVMASTHPADHNAANLAINDIVVFVKPTAWTALTLTGGWTAMAGYQPPRYRKVGDVVELRGMLTTGVSGTSAFTLPAGFRVPSAEQLPLPAYTSTAVAAFALTYPDGTFVIITTGINQCGISCRFSTVA